MVEVRYTTPAAWQILGMPNPILVPQKPYFENGKAEPRRLYREVVSVESDEQGFPPKNLLAFQGWLSGVIAEIPEDARDDAKIEITGTGSDDYGYTARLEVTYSRVETSEEVAQRVARYHADLAAWNAHQRAEEEAEYERLAAKLGKST